MKNRAFTLIELLVVVLIIGILASIALPKYRVAVLRARMAQGITLVRAITLAEVSYCLANGNYTDDLNALDVAVPGSYTVSSNGKSATHSDGSSLSFWFADEKKTSGVVIWTYKGLEYMDNLSTKCRIFSVRECRALETSSLNQQVCLSMGGTYFDTYGNKKAYRLP